MKSKSVNRHSASSRRLRLGFAVTACAALFIAVTWNAYASRIHDRHSTIAYSPNASVESALSATSETDASQRSHLDLGRLHLRAGSHHRAIKLLRSANVANWADEMARSFLMWQAHSNQSGDPEAKNWRDRFLAGTTTMPEVDREYFEQLGELSAKSSSWAVASTTPQAALQPKNDDLRVAARHLEKARQDYSSGETIENRIRLSTWLLLFGELSGDIERGGLHSLAIDTIAEGLEHLEAIEEEIVRDPNLEERISKETAVAIRLDAARVRRVSIERRLALARSEETERLKQLRDIVRTYRDLTQRLSLVHAEYFIGDYESAKKLNAAALADAAKISEVVQKRRDYFLFSDEPQIAADTDFAAAVVAPEPFSGSVIAHLKGLHALLAFRLAERNADPKTLSEAEGWANAALGTPNAEPIEGIPVGHDENCITGLYALALVNELQGATITAKEPFVAERRAEAKAKFDSSLQEMARVQELLLGRKEKTAATVDLERGLAAIEIAPQDATIADDTLRLAAFADAPNDYFSTLAADVKRRTDLLTSPAAYLQAAEKATLSGDAIEAWSLLTDGVRRHSDSVLTAAWIDAGRRSNADLDELRRSFDAAASAGILKAESPESRLVSSKLTTSAVWRQISQVGIGNLDESVKSNLDAELSVHEQQLRSAISAAERPREDVRAELQSYLALIIAYRTMIMPQSDAARNAEDGYRIAKDAAAAEDALLKEAKGLRSVELREALVAARLAIGHLSIVALPNYRDESMLAFASAFDESAKLPVATADLKSVASPMLNAVMNRPENAAGLLAQEERQQRLLITKFLEAAFTVNFGAAKAASDQMRAALATVPQTSTGSSANPEASALLAGADGFESKAALRDSVRAFQVLTDITAGRGDAALAESCRIVIPNRVSTPKDDRFIADLSSEDLELAASRIQSPLVGYAFANALEVYADSLPGLSNARRPQLMKSADKLLAVTETLLQSPATSSRYPQLVTLTQDAHRRLSDAAFYLDLGQDFKMRGDVAAAVFAFERGVKRHPQNAELWQALFEARLNDVLIRGSSESGSYDQLLDQLTQAESTRLLPTSLTDYFRGVIYRRQGKTQDAERLLLLARSSATGRDRVRISSELATLLMRETSNVP